MLTDYNGRAGLLVQGERNVQAKGNSITIKDGGNSLYTDRYGILFNGTVSTYVTCNDIIGPRPAQAGTYGLACYGNGSNGFAKCNVFDSTEVGAHYYNAMFDTYEFAGNEIQSHVHGLRLGEPGAGNTGVVIQPQNHTGNRWTGSYSAYGAINYEDNNQGILNNQFFVDDGGAPLEPTWDDPNYIGSVFWFRDDIPSGGNYFECSVENDTTCPAVISEDSEFTRPETDWDSDFLIRTAQDSLEFSEYEDALRWRARQMLAYALLTDETQADTIEAYADFLDSMEVSGELAFTEITLGFNELHPKDTSLYEDMSSCLDTLKILGDTLYVVDTLLADEPSGQDSIDLNHKKDSLTDRRQVLLDRLDSLRQIEMDTIIARAETLKLENDSLTASGIYEVNEKKVNEIVLTALSNDTVFTRANLDTLAAIAAQCPVGGGTAVYRARGLLADTTAHNDFSSCLVSRSAEQESPLLSKGKALSIFPNPASTQVTLVLPSLGGDAEIQFMDGLGRRLKTINVQEGTLQTTLPIADYAPGFYYLILQQNGKILERQTLVISR